MNYLADIRLRPGGFKGLGSTALANPTDGIGTLANIISVSLGIITIVGIIWFVFILATGAISMMSAGADKGAAEAARKRISSGIIGLVLLITGVFLIDLIGFLLGFPIGGILNIESLFSTTLTL